MPTFLVICMFMLRHLPPCLRPVTPLPLCGEFPAQMASNTENVSIWWRHHGLCSRHIGCWWPSDARIQGIKKHDIDLLLWHIPMMTSSNGNIFRVTGPLCGEFTGPVNSPHKYQWRRALMFSVICVWINGWVNNREAGDLRRHYSHYDVNVMRPQLHNRAYNWSQTSIRVYRGLWNDVSKWYSTQL